MPSNGRLDTSTLVLVDGWAYLTPNTAAAWNAGCDELVSLGYPRPTITAPDGAYRPYAQQVAMKKYWTAQGKPENAATAGTSGHGWATDVDIFKNWLWPHSVLVEVFGKYGFIFNVPWELWHMHRPSTSTASLAFTRINEEDEMTPDQANKLEAVYQALWNGGSNTVDGQVQKYNYGVLPIIVNSQNLIARVITEQAALSAAVNAISTGNVDVAAVTAAARAGAEAALADLHIPTSGTITLN